MRIGVFISDVSGAQTDVEELLANARAAEALGFTTGCDGPIPSTSRPPAAAWVDIACCAIAIGWRG